MYETILVGVDGSEHAKNVLEHAIELAEAIDATLHVVTVVDTRTNPMKFGVNEVTELDRAKSDLVDEISNVPENVDLTGEIRRGEPVDVLLEYATEVDADLLIIGESDTDTLEAAIFGGTVERLTEETRIPLTIVPLPGER